MTRALRMLVASLLLIPLLGACGSDDDADTATDETTTTAAEAAEPVAFGASEYSYTAPESVSGGTVTWTFNNTGKENHQFAFYRMDDGKTISDVATYLKNEDKEPFPEWLHRSGGPNNAPGSTHEYTGTFDAGTYALVCHVPGPDGVRHHDKGMLAVVEVTEPAEQATPPAADVTITAKDFAFGGTEGVKAGKQVVKFTNEGPEEHESILFELTPGSTKDDLLKFLTSSGPPTGPPPFTNVDGLASELPAGQDAYVDVTWKPDTTYALMCFVVNQKGPHFIQGMVSEFKAT